MEYFSHSKHARCNGAGVGGQGDVIQGAVGRTQNESLEDSRNNGAQAVYRARRARSRGANATFFALRLPPNKDLETAFVVNKVAMAKRRGTVRLNKTLGGRFELDHKPNK